MLNNSRDILETNPKVTIGLPFSQEPEEYFLLAIQSVFAQTHKNWELFLVADGASPRLLEIAENIDDPRVFLFNDGLQKGLAARLNEVAAKADGEFLVRMDADDIMHPGRIKHSLEFFKKSPELCIVSTRAFQIDDNSEVVGTYNSYDGPLTPQSMFLTSPIIHPSVITRKNWSLDNPYDEKFLRAQDKELWIRAVNADNYLLVKEALLFYRVGRNLTFKKHKTSNSFDRQIVKLYGPQKIGKSKTLLILIRSYLKQFSYNLILKMGRQKELYNRRFTPLSSKNEQNAVDELLSFISRIKIPSKV